MLDSKKLKLLVREKEAFLNSLEEFDRSHQLRKINYKERVNFTIDENLMILFRKYCNNTGMSMSKIVEECIKSKIKDM
ncbi:MAG: hypothetical protein PHU51_02445 [Candidatus Nanoarchaeia archaeon]|nr:hypothetical protein [Candidatus Nanoarchaeia archaeon]